MSGPAGAMPPGPPQGPPPGMPPGYAGPPIYTQPPHFGPPPPSSGRLSAAAIVIIFIGVLVALAVVAAIVVGLSAPPPPVAPCQPGQPCAPPATLLPVPSGSPFAFPGATPQAPGTPRPSGVPGPTLAPPVQTPTSDSPPALSGEQFRDNDMGWAFEYSSRAFSINDSGPGFVVLFGTSLDMQVWVDVKTADTSPNELLASELADVDRFLIGRVTDSDGYDALLGPSIGYVQGDGGVWTGTLVSRDGSPLAPGGVTAVVATDGRLTAAVVVIVGNPDARLGDETQQHAARSASDLILKTFKWNTQ